MANEFRGVRFSLNQSSGHIDIISDNKKDDGVKVFKEMELGRFYILTLILSILTFILDLYLHCWIAYIYYKAQEVTFFTLTLIFIIVPALTSSAFSMRWYLQDEDEPSMKRQPLWKWCIRIIMLVLQLAPLLRYYDTLAYGILSSIHKKKGNLLNQQKYLRMMIDEETNASLLRLLSCFLMSAPQAIIQLVFLLSQYKKAFNSLPITFEVTFLGYQTWAILCSVVSISWALTTYHRSVRFAREDKEKLSTIAAIFIFCWNAFSATSRILALSLLATLYPAWFVTICIAHWLVMSLWIDMVHHQSSLCASRCEEIIFNIALGLAYIIAFISPKDGPTRYSYLAYYLVCFIENTATLVVWCVSEMVSKNPEFHYGIIAVQVLSFILGIFFAVSYYRFYHPNGNTTVIKKTVNLAKHQYNNKS
ncbi:conserved hypothetical protein [Pediculus humanus corporis]|uniref:XK-related protein n=1 Tax=Pediculus humanus subsp. corporis TaxID=121224 RepID=E0VH93_PEDHC|nr:uncharacterized protein Phum_PHUM204090 [Pediculus humanus corporis]EEB12749.1 conserved hypothetical protein [Pediculus humanus corporis]